MYKIIKTLTLFHNRLNHHLAPPSALRESYVKTLCENVNAKRLLNWWYQKCVPTSFHASKRIVTDGFRQTSKVLPVKFEFQGLSVTQFQNLWGPSDRNTLAQFIQHYLTMALWALLQKQRQHTCVDSVSPPLTIVTLIPCPSGGSNWVTRSSWEERYILSAEEFFNDTQSGQTLAENQKTISTLLHWQTSRKTISILLHWQTSRKTISTLLHWQTSRKTISTLLHWQTSRKTISILLHWQTSRKTISTLLHWQTSRKTISTLLHWQTNRKTISILLHWQTSRNTISICYTGKRVHASSLQRLFFP